MSIDPEDKIDDESIKSIKRNTPIRHKWKTSDGRVIFVDEMKDSHLLNAHRLVSERLKSVQENTSAAWSMSAFLTGDMATFQIERDIEMLEELQGQVSKVEKVLKVEIDRRKLTPLPLRPS